MIDAVVVCYNPNRARLSEVIEAVRHEVNTIWLIDNSDEPRHQAPLADGRVKHLAQQRNIGIAAAQNIGIERAIANKAERILLLDQDSVMDEGAVTELNSILSSNDNIASVGSNYRLGDRQVPSVFVRNAWFRFKRVAPADLGKTDRCEVDFMISSGSLISKSAIEQVGVMNARYFIDHVDTEWCLRARAQGYRLFGAVHSGMSHSLGEHFRVVKFGRSRFIPYHKPFRYYYIFRNSLWLYAAPFTSLKFISADIVRLISIFFICILATNDRKESLVMLWKGLKDGVLGSTANAPIPVAQNE